MIEVRVGEKDEIDPGQIMNRQGRCSETLRPDRDSRQSNSDAREERRVGNNPYAEEIYQNGRVPEPGHRKPFATPLRRFRFGKGRGYWSSAVEYRFAPKVGCPTAHA